MSRALGLGADLGITPYLRVGAQWAVDWQRSLFLGEGRAVTSFLSTEGALLVELVWDRPDETPDEPASDAD